MPTLPSDPIQHSGSNNLPDEHVEETASTTPVHALFHPLMIPPFNPYYWPYFFNLYPMMLYPFAQFPIVPPLQVACPFHAATCCHFQQSMNPSRHVQPFGIPPHVAAQITNTGSGTVNMNITTFKERNDNSTNVKIEKNGAC